MRIIQSYKLNSNLNEFKQKINGCYYREEKTEFCKRLLISPIFKWMNASIINASEGSVTIKLKVTRDLVNPVKCLHGGIQSAILDEAIGIAGSTIGDSQFLFAIDFYIDFMRPAILGQELLIKAEVIRRGHNIFNCIGRIETVKGKVISHANSNLMKKPN